jgi:ribosomal protein S8
LADHSSIGLDELDIEFEARLIFGDDKTDVSNLKRSLLGLFKKEGYDHNIKNIEVDSGKNTDRSGMAKIKVKFKSDEKPEAVSRLVDAYIQNLSEPNIIKS